MDYGEWKTGTNLLNENETENIDSQKERNVVKIKFSHNQSQEINRKYSHPVERAVMENANKESGSSHQFKDYHKQNKDNIKNNLPSRSKQKEDFKRLFKEKVESSVRECDALTGCQRRISLRERSIICYISNGGSDGKRT